MQAVDRIINDHMVEWREEFIRKSADYNSKVSGFEPHTLLGIPGQFADIWRKVWKLKKALWDGDKLTGEQPKEIIRDLISHLFLTLDMLEQRERESFIAEERAYIKDIVGHLYDGCTRCIDAREKHPNAKV